MWDWWPQTNAAVSPSRSWLCTMNYVDILTLLTQSQNMYIHKYKSMRINRIIWKYSLHERLVSSDCVFSLYFPSQLSISTMERIIFCGMLLSVVESFLCTVPVGGWFTTIQSHHPPSHSISLPANSFIVTITININPHQLRSAPASLWFLVTNDWLLIAITSPQRQY